MEIFSLVFLPAAQKRNDQRLFVGCLRLKEQIPCASCMYFVAYRSVFDKLIASLLSISFPVRTLSISLSSRLYSDLSAK